MMKFIKDNLIVAGASALALFLVVVVIGNAMDMPDVKFSYSSNMCVEVVNYGDTNYSCENLPSKFNHIWVE
jgi:hypothetical protein